MGETTHLDERAYDTQGSKAKILEWSSLGRGIEERVQKEGYMG